MFSCPSLQSNNNLKIASVSSDILYNMHSDTGSLPLHILTHCADSVEAYPTNFHYICQLNTSYYHTVICIDLSKINVNQYYVQCKIIILNCQLSACLLACLHASYSFTHSFRPRFLKFKDANVGNQSVIPKGAEWGIDLRQYCSSHKK